MSPKEGAGPAVSAESVFPVHKRWHLNVLDCLPRESKITEDEEIYVENRETYFVKPFFRYTWYTRVALPIAGLLNSLQAIHTLMPAFASKPVGWSGRTLSGKTDNFVVMEFLHLGSGLPDASGFCGLVAAMHREGKSPREGIFGFHGITKGEHIFQPDAWTSSWRESFTKLITTSYEEAITINKLWPGSEDAFETLKTRVIPWLLDPLQADGNVLKPSLVHGDLRERNTGINNKTREPVVFNPSCLYAHNEYELGIWRDNFFRVDGTIARFDNSYVEEYKKYCLPSEPVDEFDARNLLYSIKFNLSLAARHPTKSDAIRAQ